MANENNIVPKASCRADITELILQIFGACADAQVNHNIPLHSPEYVDLTFLWLDTANAITNLRTQATPEYDVITTEIPGDRTTTEEITTEESGTTADETVESGYTRVDTTSQGDQTSTTTDGGGDDSEQTDFYTNYP